MPTALIYAEDSLRILVDMAGDFGQALRHRA